MPDFAVFKPLLQKRSSRAKTWLKASRVTPKMRDILASGTGPAPKAKPKVKPQDYYATPEMTVRKRKNADIRADASTKRRKIPVPSMISERTAVPVPGAIAERKPARQVKAGPQEPARAAVLPIGPTVQPGKNRTGVNIVDRADREAVEQVFGPTTQGAAEAQPAPARLASIVTADEKLSSMGKRDRDISQLAQSVRNGKLNQAASVPPGKVSSMLEKALGGKINANRATRSQLGDRITNIHNQFVGAVARPRSKKDIAPITGGSSAPRPVDSGKTESRLMGMLRNNDTAHVAKVSADRGAPVPLGKRLEKTLNNFQSAVNKSPAPREVAPITAERRRELASESKKQDRTLSPTAGASVGGTAAYARSQSSAVEVSAKAPVAKFNTITPEVGGISKALSESSKGSSGAKTLKGSVQMTGPNGQSIGNLDFNSVEMV